MGLLADTHCKDQLDGVPGRPPGNPEVPWLFDLNVIESFVSHDSWVTLVR